MSSSRAPIAACARTEAAFVTNSMPTSRAGENHTRACQAPFEPSCVKAPPPEPLIPDTSPQPSA